MDPFDFDAEIKAAQAALTLLNGQIDQLVVKTKPACQWFNSFVAPVGLDAPAPTCEVNLKVRAMTTAIMEASRRLGDLNGDLRL